MTITQYSNDDAVIWNQLYYSNPNLSPYQSLDFLGSYIKLARSGKYRFFLHNQILRISIDEINVICPISIDKTKKQLYLLGDFSSVGYCDMIYDPDVNEKHFSIIIQELKSRFDGYSLHFNKLNEKSQLCKFLLKHNQPYSSNECVSIALGDDINQYYKSLSKHTRQNIRTAYNRISKNNIQLEHVIVSDKERLTKTQKNEMCKLYAKRLKNKLGQRAMPYPVTFAIQRYFNPISKLSFQLDNQFHSLLYIDGNLAAFISGFKNSNSSTIVVPKLSMSDNYSHYDPGIILIFETAKYLCSCLPFTELDLSRGGESYKYAMGGKTHLNYSFEI